MQNILFYFKKLINKLFILLLFKIFLERIFFLIILKIGKKKNKKNNI